MAPKYIAKIIHRTTCYVGAQTGDCLPRQPNSEQALLDSFQPTPKYMFVELYSNIGQLTGNTMRELLEVLFASSHDVPADAVLYFTRKGGKPYAGAPVGSTFLPNF